MYDCSIAGREKRKGYCPEATESKGEEDVCGEAELPSRAPSPLLFDCCPGKGIMGDIMLFGERHAGALRDGPPGWSA